MTTPAVRNVNASSAESHDATAVTAVAHLWLLSELLVDDREEGLIGLPGLLGLWTIHPCLVNVHH
jgi:hypothetical protein